MHVIILKLKIIELVFVKMIKERKTNIMYYLSFTGEKRREEKRSRDKMNNGKPNNKSEICFCGLWPKTDRGRQSIYLDY